MHDTQSGYYAVKDLGVKIVVGIICLLAMLGSVFVILSYFMFKSLRSQARHILVNLSLMDFGIAIANLTGIVANFDGYFYNNTEPETHMEVLCSGQAFVAAISTYSSIMWTISLAIYMYLLVFQFHRYPLRYYMHCCYPFCYGIGVGMSLWLLLTKRLGYAPYNSSGWCGIIINTVTGPAGHGTEGSFYYNSSGFVEKHFAGYGDYGAFQKPVAEYNVSDVPQFSTDYFAVIGYDFWVYLAIIMCITLYLALFLQLKFGYTAAMDAVGSRTFWLQALQFLDYKLLLIPLGFILVRMWTCIVNILFTYAGLTPNDLPAKLNEALIYLSGIGDSGQGLVNGLIFVFFTAEVRQLMLSLVKRCRRRAAQRGDLDDSGNINRGPASNHGNEQTPLLRGNNLPTSVGNFLTPPNSLSETVTQPTRK